MRKFIKIILLCLFVTIICLNINSYAASLDNINVETSKTTVRPGESVKVNIIFGESLGAYTFSVAYDDNIFEYVDSEGGTANDTGDKVNIVYFDQTGGSNPRTNMNVTFKAKDDIDTSNPTEFNITASGLANIDASVTFDDITSPITKNVIVEPEYVDYKLSLTYTGDVIKDEEKNMKIVYSSSLGKYYGKARLIAEVSAPKNANAKLLATDSQNVEHDIIQSGWGEEQGYGIGGKDYKQELNVRGIFSEIGEYSITLKLIDRSNSDSVIVSDTFKINVKEAQKASENQNTVNNIQNTSNNIVTNNISNNVNTVSKPAQLPKTGNNVYIAAIGVILLLGIAYFYFNYKK